MTNSVNARLDRPVRLIGRNDMDAANKGTAVILRLITGPGLKMVSSSGPDSGTGDVKIAVDYGSVEAGTYNTFTLDSYGRIIKAWNESYSESPGSGNSILNQNKTAQAANFWISHNGRIDGTLTTVYSVTTSTQFTKSSAQVLTNSLWFDGTHLYFNNTALDAHDTSIATRTVLGSVIVGDGLDITQQGVLSVDLPVASKLQTGVVQIGSGLSITEDGVISVSVAVASTTRTGVVQIGSGLSITDAGVLSADIPTPDDHLVLATALDATPGTLSAKIVSGNTNYMTVTTVAGTRSVGSATIENDTISLNVIEAPPTGAAGGDLTGTYPNPVVCQLTGIGAALRAKTLKDASGNDLAWTYGSGDNGANYGRSCIPGYAYVVNALGAQVHKRIWCAFGRTGEIYNSFDRYQSTTHDVSLIAADSSYNRIGAGNASCAAYIKDGTDYYWIYGGFVDNYVYALKDIPANYNSDGTFKTSGWIWTACPTLPKNTAHICSVQTGGFLYTGYQLGGINYKSSIASTGIQAFTNPSRLNKDVVGVFAGNGSTTVFDFYAESNQSYNGYYATAVDNSGNTVAITTTLYIPASNQFEVYFQTAPASGVVVTVTVVSFQDNPTYTGAGFSGVGSDHYGTYNAIDRDTGRIYTNTSEATTGTFTPSAFTLLPIFLRESVNDSYGVTKVDRLGTSHGALTSDPYTWWSSIQSAYGLWVATTALKQYPNDPIYAYSDDGIHWTKYTDGVGTGSGSTLAIWDSQSDGMNWYVTNMYSATPLIFELLVDSISAHKRLVCEKGIGVSGDIFLPELPNVSALGTDENGKIIPGSGVADIVPASAELIGSRADKSLLAKRITVSTDLPDSPPTENDLFWIVPA